MGDNSHFNKIVEVVKSKASIKQKIYRNTLKAFEEIKASAKSLIEELENEAESFDEGVSISFTEKSAFEFQIKVGGDIILYHMHSNVFNFDKSHLIWKSNYTKEDLTRSYCGNINIYNFLADSFKYNRFDDIGYLIGRVFVNKENHFFVEGKRHLNYIHNDFTNQTIDKVCVRNIIEHSILYSMDFDLYTPPYKHVQEISVGQLLTERSGMRLKTGKRVGYKFSFEDE